MQNLKTFVRDMIPDHLQIPVRFLYETVRGFAEPETCLLPFLVRSGSHVCDVGGNRGHYAYKLWRLGARLEVFEPNPVCARLLQRWAAGKHGIAIHPIALSSQSGTATLHIPVDIAGIEHDASASLGREPAPHCRAVDVSLEPLDSFGFDDLDFIKIDVEGHEGEVLAGAIETLRRAHPALLVEIEQRHHAEGPMEQIFDLILQADYRGYFLSKGQLLPLHAFEPARHQSMAAFDAGPDTYHNNFLFLSEARVDAGEYTALFQRYGGR